MSAYLGTVVTPPIGEPYVLCFLSHSPQMSSYTEDDLAMLPLLSQGIAYMLNQQKSQAQHKATDTEMLASGHIKTFDEYIDQARLPDLIGVPSRVVSALQNRIGKLPLSIDHIASDLSSSKRTLQRRLQQQNINFAELRDQIRYHYSIQYLIRDRMNIHTIAKSLDFSDRTSFTNAFKRWTELSPSAFRKLFRDFL